MKRKTRTFFEDRNGAQREYDPADFSGRQLVYPADWYEEMPEGSHARAQHERIIAMHAKVHGFIRSDQKLEEYFDTGPVDGSGCRDLYSEHTPAFESGDYATDLKEWGEMLSSILALVDLDYELDWDEDELESKDAHYFDMETRSSLRAPLRALEAELASFLASLEGSDSSTAAAK